MFKSQSMSHIINTPSDVTYETETVISDDDSNSNGHGSCINNFEKYNKKDKTVRSDNGILTFLSNEISLGLTPELAKLKNNAKITSENKKELCRRVNGVTKFNVHFSEVVIREYPYEIGDNPSSKKGPSLSMKWSYVKEQTCTLTSYEQSKSQMNKRSMQELLIPLQRRMDILREAGYSRSQIIQFTKNVDITRRHRRRTLETLNMSHVEEMTEQIGRQAINILTFGRKHRHEKKYLKQALSFY